MNPFLSIRFKQSKNLIKPHIEPSKLSNYKLISNPIFCSNILEKAIAQ